MFSGGFDSGGVGSYYFYVIKASMSFTGDLNSDESYNFDEVSLKTDLFFSLVLSKFLTIIFSYFPQSLSLFCTSLSVPFYLSWFSLNFPTLLFIDFLSDSMCVMYISFFVGMYDRVNLCV